jgi:hypothetical protein
MIRFYQIPNDAYLSYIDMQRNEYPIQSRSWGIKEKELIHICIFDTIIKHIGTQEGSGPLSEYCLYTFIVGVTV